jgi:hypothetical protein
VREEESNQRAREMYAALPEEMKGKLQQAAYKVVAEACAESGTEVTDELVAATVVEALRQIVGNLDALVHEALTDEEMRRIIDEEVARLDTGEGVDEEVLTDAVAKRAREEHGYLFNRSRPK